MKREKEKKRQLEYNALVVIVVVAVVDNICYSPTICYGMPWLLLAVMFEQIYYVIIVLYYD